jgi:hypothetical protein
MITMMVSFAEQPSIRFYIGNISKSVVVVLSSHAFGFRFDFHPRSWQIAEQQAIA